ncbi:MAG: hypothetical protein OHK0029_40390 [Armatimonadaceae bacterium]
MAALKSDQTGKHPVRRQPIRTCVACRETGGKRGLLRVVRLPDAAGVALDRTGKQSGRGAYVCATPACVAQALKQKKLERSLQVAIPETVADELRRAAESVVEMTADAARPTAAATITGGSHQQGSGTTDSEGKSEGLPV